MDYKPGQNLKWSRSTWILAIIAGVIATIFAFLAMQNTTSDIIRFWQVVLPIAIGLIGYGMTGFLVNYWKKWQWAKSLEEIDYPFGSVAFFFGVHIFVLLYVYLVYFLGLLVPDSPILKFLSSLPLMILFLASLFVISGAGGQVIINVKPDGVIYRDTVSKSRLSRQDLFFSHRGSYKDGLIFGWQLFPYDTMIAKEKYPKSFRINGKEPDGQDYIFIIYTPRNIEWAEEKLENKLES